MTSDFKPSDDQSHYRMIQCMTVLEGFAYRKAPFVIKTLKARLKGDSSEFRVRSEVFRHVGDCCECL